MFLELWRRKNVERIDWKTVTYDQGISIIVGFIATHKEYDAKVEDDYLRKVIRIVTDEFTLKIKCTKKQCEKIMEMI